MTALYGWEELWTHKKIQILFLLDTQQYGGD